MLKKLIITISLTSLVCSTSKTLDYCLNRLGSQGNAANLEGVNQRMFCNCLDEIKQGTFSAVDKAAAENAKTAYCGL